MNVSRAKRKERVCALLTHLHIALCLFCICFPSACTSSRILSHLGRRVLSTATPTSANHRTEFYMSTSSSGSNIGEVRKGFNILELIPGGQGPLVYTARELWRLEWKILMTELAPQSKSGGYIRESYSSAETLTAAVVSDQERYHLYIGNPCPWCHRVDIAAKLRGLQSKHLSITYLVDDPTKASRGGWIFGNSEERRDPVFGQRDLRGVYDKCAPADYRGRITAPLLVDKKQKKFVSNLSKEIVRLLSNLGDDLNAHPHVGAHLFPRTLHTEDSGSSSNSTKYSTELPTVDAVEELNEWIYQHFNNGVYRAGFATSQAEYSIAVNDVTAALLALDERLSKSRFLLSDAIVSESDVFLLPTIERYDAIYNTLFRCTGLRVVDCSHLRRWYGDMLQLEGGAVRGCFDLQDAVRSYYQQMFPLNPSGIVPALPQWQMQLRGVRSADNALVLPDIIS